MTPVQLQEALQAVEPAAVLVTPSVLDKIIRQALKLPAWMWSVPHHESWIVDRQLLFRHVEQEDLLVKPDRLLPATVLLLELPESRENHLGDERYLLREYWRRLFHASVDLAFINQAMEGKWTAEVVEDRVGRLGRTVFEEIRTVLEQENRLPPHADDRTVYFEFVAFFWEMHYFARPLLGSFFPGIADLAAAERIAGQDVDAEGFMRRTRLPGSAELPAETRTRSREAHEYFDKLIAESDAANGKGNVVRGAIQRRKAARVAPAPQAYETRRQAIDALDRLLDRLQPALELASDELPQWRKHIPELLDKADQGSHPPEAAILFDLQAVCLDFEREIYTLDLVEWILTGGRKPIKRPLLSQQIVRVTRHLRGIVQRLNLARLSDADRKDLAGLLQQALQRCEARVRERFRPILFSALEDVGLKPVNPPERTAFRKMVEELLDRIIEYGFLSFSDLRDALSRNQLKLPDLADPQDFIQGDPLLRLDRRLATLLDGVYRRGEFYLRWLERFTAINFGTKLGRLLTLYTTIPFGGAFLVLLAIQHFLLQPLGAQEHPLWMDVVLWLSLGAFFLGLLYSSQVRKRFGEGCKTAWRNLRLVVFDFPVWVWRNAHLHRIISTWTFQIGYWYVFKPLVLCGLLWLFQPNIFETWLGAVIAFLGANFVINSRAGRAVAEGIGQAFINFFAMLRAGLIPGIVRLMVQFFKHVMHLTEAILFHVDEWLRFRKGDSRTALAFRVVLGLLWWPIAYFVRFNLVVLIEPCFNPLKFPVCSLAYKVLLPLYGTIGAWLSGILSPVLPDFLAVALVGWLLWWGPDVFGFLFWEIKENWSLYRANRGRALKPVPIGAHGETMRHLLQPGFHSGAVPKLFRRLRRAEMQARQTGNFSGVRSCRAALDEVEEALRQFVDRELLVLLDQDPGWQGQVPRIGQILLATNRVQIELILPGKDEGVLWLDFEKCASQLIAGLRDIETLERLPTERRRSLHNGLALLFKLAGVDTVVAGQREAAMGAVPISWKDVVRSFPDRPTGEINNFLVGDLAFLPHERTPAMASVEA
ncbi:MAG: hypothetical protein HY040_07900 [Planctomycetes bacterium]|nr:hypothetical protein [Planctomycetota bacterium]